MLSSVITRKGQVTIPKTVRDEVDWHEGDRVIFVVRGREVLLKVIRGSILDLAGSVEPRSRPEDFDQAREVARQSRAERAARHG